MRLRLSVLSLGFLYVFTAFTSMARAEGAHDEHMQMMHGLLGTYPMQRDASGTAWQPDNAEHTGNHITAGDWQLMYHAAAELVYTEQGGGRGADRFYSTNMFMFMANRPAGGGRLGFRSMMSLEPATIGKSGYPLLLQTGETADGMTHLIDRQHPHDLFMELAATYSHAAGAGDVFTYLGVPGEPALGPVTFMHRFSGMDFPDSPITHHWLDSTHITYGVLTAGYAEHDWKFEVSRFNGREPDQFRYNFDPVRFDSWAARATWNPAAAWSMQVSGGSLHSPEQLSPDVDVRRLTASVTYDTRVLGGEWQTTAAFGQNRNSPGNTLDAVLVESAWNIRGRHTVLGRLEWAQKDELFPEGDVRDGRIYGVSKVSGGYIYDFLVTGKQKLGVGGLLSVALLPGSLDTVYGSDPVSLTVFLRWRF